MKRKSLILFLIVTITVLSMSAIYRTYAKYKFTVQNDINISTEDGICLFDSDTLNLNIHSVEIADGYGTDSRDMTFGLVVVLYSINNIKENNNG